MLYSCFICIQEICNFFIQRVERKFDSKENGGSTDNGIFPKFYWLYMLNLYKTLIKNVFFYTKLILA